MYIEDDLEESLDDALEELMYIAEDLEGTSDEEFAQAARPYWEAGVIGKSCENLTPAQERERFLQVCREMGLPDAAVLRQSQEQLRIAT